jgi:hypothetical protein
VPDNDIKTLNFDIYVVYGDECVTKLSAQSIAGKILTDTGEVFA